LLVVPDSKIVSTQATISAAANSVSEMRRTFRRLDSRRAAAAVIRHDRD
jgi:hypothetical protein